MRGWGLVYKRLVDILASFIGILILSPILALVALLVKLSSKGPILYRQQRMGIDGSTFDCLKFRSMPITSENETGAVWTKKGDTRATPVGSFIRKYSIDELPQLFNVLMGDMSLVGPRPERPVFVNEFRHKIPGYMLRHKVRAGRQLPRSTVYAAIHLCLRELSSTCGISKTGLFGWTLKSFMTIVK